MVRVLGIAVLIIVAGLGLGNAVLPFYAANDQAVAVLSSTDTVQVTTQPWLAFQPYEVASKGLIIYPGARVDPKAYAPLAMEIASHGYVVVIVPMPLHLAVLGVNKATEVIHTYADIEQWTIAGHSLGGAMAAKYVYDYPTVMSGLILLAAYPGNNQDLANWEGQVVSISATHDNLATPDKIERTMDLLPKRTRFEIIEGGNHAQFGYYGEQRGDGMAQISIENQQSHIVQATLELLGLL